MIHKTPLLCINTFACAYFNPGWTASQLNSPLHKTSYGKSCLLTLFLHCWDSSNIANFLFRSFAEIPALVQQWKLRDNAATTHTAPTIIRQPHHGPFMIHVVTVQEIFLHFFITCQCWWGREVKNYLKSNHYSS